MNRRSFVKNLAGLGLFSILPGAGRVWKVEKIIDHRTIINPNWVKAEYECVFLTSNMDLMVPKVVFGLEHTPYKWAVIGNSFNKLNE